VPHITLHSKPSRALLAAFALLPFLGACDWLSGVSQPEELRIEIESEDIPTATLITSTFFLRIADPECPLECEAAVQLVASDTTIVTLPYDQILPFTDRQQFFVETFPTLPEEVTLAMRVSIDGREWFDDFRTLLPIGGDGDPETLRFVYQFAQLRIPGA
jgi:hypothetical protein